MPTGTVKLYSISGSYGFIEPDDAGEDVHVHWSAIRGDGFRHLVTGERVRYEFKRTDRNPQATWVETAGSRVHGIVESWDQMRGTGRILPNGESTSVFFHYSDVLSVGRATAVEGEAVTFELHQTAKGRKAVRVKRLDPRPALYRFGRMRDEEEWTLQLAQLAESEDWDRYGESGSESSRPILASYLIHTFARLEIEERELASHTKIAEAESEGVKYACLNTGLVTPLQEEIFAFLKANRANPEVAPWSLIGFFPQSDRRLDAVFGGRLPELARYFNAPSELIYDPDIELVVDVAHIVEDNLERFPPPFKDNPYIAQQALESQISRLRRRARRNYKTAVPQYHHGSIQLLLPLSLSRPEHADLALVVHRTGDCYRAATVLPLQWAYRNARLLTRPDPDWLVPD